MKYTLAHVARRPKLLVGAFVLAVLVTGFFAVRLVFFSIYWADPSHSDQHIEGWMTARYVALSWDLPPEVVAEALHMTSGLGEGRRLTLEQIAARDGISLSEIEASIYSAIEAHRANQ